MTEQEVATQRRLRLACEFLAQIAASEPTDLPPLTLTEEAVQAIHHYESTHLKQGDLLAIRNRPGQYCLTNPYAWLWVLHCYQNNLRQTQKGKSQTDPCEKENPNLLGSPK
jgi:hypothetical protein